MKDFCYNIPKTELHIHIEGTFEPELVFEIAKLGHDVEANDFSFFNCLITDYIFNNCKKDEIAFQPLIRSFYDQMTEDSVFTKYTFPCVDFASDVTKEIGKMEMSPGDFIEIYKKQPEKYDCVITCFFIDTAKNILSEVGVMEEFHKSKRNK